MADPMHFFASYAREDKEYVEPVVDLLRSGSARVFLDQDNIRPGDQWKVVLEKNLDEASTLLVFWSRHARKSEWVTKEWRDAVEGNKRVIPILLDGSDLPDELADYQFIDFRHFRRPKRWVPVASGLPFAAACAWLLLNQPNEKSIGIAVREGEGPVVTSPAPPDPFSLDNPVFLVAAVLIFLAIVIPLILVLRRKRTDKKQSLELAKDIASNLSK